MKAHDTRQKWNYCKDYLKINHPCAKEGGCTTTASQGFMGHYLHPKDLIVAQGGNLNTNLTPANNHIAFKNNWKIPLHMFIGQLSDSKYVSMCGEDPLIYSGEKTDHISTRSLIPTLILAEIK